MTTTLGDIDLDYKETVEVELKERLGFEIPNSTLEHAILVQTKLIESTEQSLSILTGEASEIDHPEIKTSLMILARKLRNPSISSKLENRIARFLNPKNRNINQAKKGIRIIMYNNETEASKDFESFFRDYRDIVQIRKYRPVEGKFPHFLVSDGIRYREEKIHFDKDFVEYKINSKANFNDASIGLLLEGLFGDIWERLE